MKSHLTAVSFPEIHTCPDGAAQQTAKRSKHERFPRCECGELHRFNTAVVLLTQPTSGPNTVKDEKNILTFICRTACWNA